MNESGHEGPPPSPPLLVQPHYSEPPGSEPSLGQRFKKLLAPIGVALMVIFKFAAKLKFLVIPLVKFLPILLKTGGTMLISIWAYAMAWGWRFALGFVLLIFVHECGHLLVARSFGLNVGAPVFIPFMGALIALKDAPKDAWMEAWVGIGGPLLGAAGAIVCEALFVPCLSVCHTSSLGVICRRDQELTTDGFSERSAIPHIAAQLPASLPR